MESYQRDFSHTFLVVGYPVPTVLCEEENLDIKIHVKSERSRRLYALCVSLVAITLLCLAVVITPSPDGVGTHQQLGLPTCGWILAGDLPCPTCGMTTAWSHAVRGQIHLAFIAQPLGLILAVAALALAIGGLITAITGYSFQSLLYKYSPTKIIIVVASMSILSWLFKILVHKGLI